MRHAHRTGDPLRHSHFRLDVVCTAEGLAALRPEWNHLLESSRSNNLFLTFEWISTWWAVYGRDGMLHVLTARDSNGHLIGVAPFKRVTRGIPRVWHYSTVEFIGQGGDVTPEYLDFIVQRGHEDAVVDAFVTHLCADSEVHVIDLRPFWGGSPNLARLHARLEEQGGHLRRAQDSICPFLELPETQQAFLASRSRNYRKKVRESERKCERDLKVQLRRSETRSELRADFSALVRLHHQRWAGASRAFQSAEYVQFHDRLSAILFERGWMRLFTLHNGEALAVLYCFAYGGRYYYYQAGRHPGFPKHRLGLVLMHKVIQEAIKERATVFDFLSGDEAYKYHWAETSAENMRLRYSKSLALLAACGLDGVFGRILGLSSMGPVAERLAQWKQASSDLLGL